MARTHRERRRGIRPGLGPVGCLLRARSVVTIGLPGTIGALAIDGAGRVLWSGVSRHRVHLFFDAVWVAEVPATGVPPIGTTLTPTLSTCPGS